MASPAREDSRSPRAPGSPSTPEGFPDDEAASGDRWTTDRRLMRLLSGDFLGIEGRPVEVQVDLSAHASPGFTIVGLPGKSTRESRDRIRTAIQNSGFRFPHQDRILVNLAPAFQKKDGAVFDLPVALGILLASGQVQPPRNEPGDFLPIGFLGELGLDGELRPVPGALLIATALRGRGVRRVVVPEANAGEVAMAPGLEVAAARDLHQAIRALRGEVAPYRRPERPAGEEAPANAPDFAEVRGQETTKRGILAAAAGGHNLLLVGHPGVGKTMLARRLPGILPPLTFEESLDVTRIYSAAGLLSSRRFEGERPFRAPHHTISYAGLAGGGSPPRPGEISLAHRGVLFLDELPEFSRKALETLRQPMESGLIAIGRSGGSVVFPARFLVVGAMNPCPCGYAGHPRIACRCTPPLIDTYRHRISGPLLDRIDILLDVAQPPAAEVLEPARAGSGLSTAAMRQEVVRARRLQARRWEEPVLNGQVSQERILARGGLTAAARDRLAADAHRRGLSARSIGRALRIARTLADLAGKEEILPGHVLEALALRRPEGADGPWM